MTRLLCLDPGTRQTGWALLETTDEAVLASGKDDNEHVRLMVRTNLIAPVSIESRFGRADAVLIEVMASIWGQSDAIVVETLLWTGRFLEAPTVPVERISRTAVKVQLLGRANVKGADAAIHRLLVDRYAAKAGDPLGGRRAAVGVKAAPGPLFGVRADAWQALAAGIAYLKARREAAA